MQSPIFQRVVAANSKPKPRQSPAPQSDMYFLGTSYNQLNLPVHPLSAMASYGHDWIGTASIDLSVNLL